MAVDGAVMKGCEVMGVVWVDFGDGFFFWRVFLFGSG